MKTWKVYELINLMGTVEYVGESTRPETRFREHTMHKPSNGKGKFYQRYDIFMNIVAEFNTRKEARDFEEILQIEYNLTTDRSRYHSLGMTIVNNGKLKQNRNLSKAGKASSAIIRICPHCDKSIKSNAYFTWHGENCKLNPTKDKTK